MNQSEIAIICTSIEREYEAAWRALYEYTEVAAHQVINAKYERMGELMENLSCHVGKEEAAKILLRTMEKAPEH